MAKSEKKFPKKNGQFTTFKLKGNTDDKGGSRTNKKLTDEDGHIIQHQTH